MELEPVARIESAEVTGKKPVIHEGGFVIPARIANACRVAFGDRGTDTWTRPPSDGAPSWGRSVTVTFGIGEPTVGSMSTSGPLSKQMPPVSLVP